MSGTPETTDGLGQSARGSWGLREALGAARALLSFPPKQCNGDPRARAWVASLENLLDYVHQCHVPAVPPAAVRAETVTDAAPTEGDSLPQTLVNHPHGKRAIQEGSGGAGTSANPRCRSREEMEGYDARHLAACEAASPTTVNDLYRLEQDAGQSLRHYICRFRGVVDRIPPKRLHPYMAVAAFYSNVRSVRMREKLSIHVMSTLEELWERAERCARHEEGRDFTPLEVV